MRKLKPKSWLGWILNRLKDSSKGALIVAGRSWNQRGDEIIHAGKGRCKDHMGDNQTLGSTHIPRAWGEDEPRKKSDEHSFKGPGTQRQEEEDPQRSLQARPPLCHRALQLVFVCFSSVTSNKDKRSMFVSMLWTPQVCRERYPERQQS